MSGCVERIACAQSIPSSWNDGRHLDVRDDHVGHVLGGGRQQRRRVLRDAHHLDVVVGVQQRPNALAHEHVVLAQHDPDAHAARFPAGMARVYHPRMIRVVFAEDNYLVREGTAALLATADRSSWWAPRPTRDELLAAVEEHTPDAVLTDIRMPPTGTNEGIEAAKTIRADHPEIGVVVLSQFVEEDYAYDLLKDGAAGLGYLLKERVADVDELVRALEEVARGGSVLDPEGRRGAGRREGPDGALAARAAHRPRARGAVAHGAGREQRGDREVAVPHRARRREAHQLPVPQARPHGGARRAPPRDGGARRSSARPATPDITRRPSLRPPRVDDEHASTARGAGPCSGRCRGRATSVPCAPRFPTTIVSARSSAATVADALGRLAALDPRAGRDAGEPRRASAPGSAPGRRRGPGSTTARRSDSGLDVEDQELGSAVAGQSSGVLHREIGRRGGVGSYQDGRHRRVLLRRCLDPP